MRNYLKSLNKVTKTKYNNTDFALTKPYLLSTNKQ